MSLHDFTIYYMIFHDFTVHCTCVFSDKTHVLYLLFILAAKFPMEYSPSFAYFPYYKIMIPSVMTGISTTLHWALTCPEGKKATYEPSFRQFPFLTETFSTRTADS